MCRFTLRALALAILGALALAGPVRAQAGSPLEGLVRAPAASPSPASPSASRGRASTSRPTTKVNSS